MTMPAEAAKNNVEIGKKDILNQQLRIARQRELMAKLERLRQLGGVCRDPPRLIPRQQLPIGHSCNTRVRCRMVSLIRGRCLTAAAKMACALPRLLPA